MKSKKLKTKLKNFSNIELKQYNNFESQEGKTKLDSHYATLKFALISYVKERNDLTSADDISKGACGRVRGAHVHEVIIELKSHHQQVLGVA